MFCEKCGQANPDEAKFCEGCGADLKAVEVEEVVVGEEVAVEETPAAAEETNVFDDVVESVKNNDLVKKIISIAVPVVAVILAVIILASLGVFTHGSERAVKKYFKAMVKGDGKAVYNLTVDPYELEKYLDNEIYDDEADAIDEYIEDAEDTVDYLEDEYGERLKVKVEVKKVTKYDKKEVKELAEHLAEEYDYDDGALKDIRVLKVKTTIEGKDDDDSDTGEIVVAKIKGKWYVNGVGNLYSKDSIESVLDGDDE